MAQVRASKRYGVPGAEMWERIGDPARLAEWHPAIAATETLEGGTRRVNTLRDGGRVWETILEHAERHHTFRVDRGPLPLDDLVATLRVRDAGEETCLVEWQSTFEPAGIPHDQAVALVRGFFEAGLDAL